MTQADTKIPSLPGIEDDENTKELKKLLEGFNLTKEQKQKLLLELIAHFFAYGGEANDNS